MTAVALQLITGEVSADSLRPCPTLTAAAAVQRWGGEAADIRAALQHGVAHEVRQRHTCRNTANNSIIDLRGAPLRGMTFRGSYALDGADLSFADLTDASFYNCVLYRTVFVSAVLNGTRFIDSHLDNARFENLVTNLTTPPQFIRVEASDTLWQFVSIPNTIIRGSTLANVRMTNVDFSGAQITDTVASMTAADRLNLYSATLDRVRLTIGRGDKVSLEMGILRAVTISDSSLAESNLSVEAWQNVKVSGLRLTRPRLGSLPLDSVPWREIIWNDAELLDEQALERDAGASSRRDVQSALQHRRVAHLYRQLEELYRRAGNVDDAERFYVARRRFERRHNDSMLYRIGSYWLEEWPDQYGTSAATLTRAALVSWVTFAAAFFVWHLHTVRRSYGAWCILSRSVEVPPNHHAGDIQVGGQNGIQPTVAASAAVYAALSGLLLFAQRIFNTQGILDLIVKRRPHLLDSSRIISGVAGVVGLYLAVRAVALI